MASMRLSQCREEDAADLLKKALELMEPLGEGARLGLGLCQAKIGP